MSWIETPSETGATGSVAAAYERDRALLGYLPNYTKLFGHRPHVYDGWIALNGAIKSTMDLRRYELATLAAGLQLGSSYCALAHGKVLATTHLERDAVRSLAAGETPSGVDETDLAVMTLARKVAAGAASLTSGDLQPLRDLGFDDADIPDVVLAAAARCFFSTVLEALGAEPDSVFLALDPAMRDALTVGRSIASAADDS